MSPAPTGADRKRRQAALTVLALVVIAVVAGATWLINGRSDDPAPATAAIDRTTATAGTATTAGPEDGAQSVPAHVTRTLALIDAGRWPEAANAPGTRGGDTFRNNERLLPVRDDAGDRITYREWDVNPKRPGRSRDAERIVTGSDGTAWYTDDHYRSFIRIRGPDA